MFTYALDTSLLNSALQGDRSRYRRMTGQRRCEMGNAAKQRSHSLHWGITQDVLIGIYEKTPPRKMK